MALQEELEQQGIWLFRYRSTLPIIVLLIGTYIYIDTELHPETFFVKNTPYENYFEGICLLVSLMGLLFRIYIVGHTPKNTSGRNVKEQVADSLNSTGAYSMVRHPLYVGNFFMWLGPALLTGNFWFIIAFCLFYWIYYERIMFAEEQYLRKKFGQAYLDWSDDVPPFIPNFKNFKKPTLPFSWKKVLKKEKNGLFAVFVIFCLFDVLGELVKEQNDYNFIFMLGFIFTGILYLILKYLKNKTEVLNEENR